MRQYASDQIKVSWFLLSLEDGLARGTFIRESRNNVSWTYKPDGLGDVIPMFNPTSSGTLTLSIDRESKQHTQLVTLANADLASRSVVAPMMITDKNSGNVALFNKVRIESMPNYLAGSGPSVVPWVFLYAQAVSQTFGFNNNVVGS